jgi:hypothetical protein
MAQYFRRIRARTWELRRTTAALKARRRTPNEIQAVIDQATAALRRAELVRRRHAMRRAVN